MSPSYVRQDEHGVLRVGDSHVMLDSIIAAFDQGHSAETIQTEYPTLSLEQVYGAIAFYLGHQDEVADYLRRQGAVWQSWRKRAASDANAVAVRLRTLRASGVTQEP